MLDTLLVTEDYQRVLENCYKNPKIKYVGSKITPLSENLEGFMGEHYKLKIRYELDGKKLVGDFFIKTMPTKSQFHKDMCDEFNVYEKEIFLYNYLFKEFERRGYDINFAPKCYLCKDQKTMVMEDLVARGFSLSTRMETFNLSRCETLIKSLALFHSAGYMLEEEQSKELGRKYRLGEEHKNVFNEVMFMKNEFMENFLGSALKMFKYVIEALPENEEFKSILRENIGNDLTKMFNKPVPGRKTIGHGDLWSNNMMFKGKDGVVQYCCLLDYQILRYNHPGFDVLLCIFENTDSAFRNKYMDYLVHYYYGCLSDALKSRGHSVENFMPLTDLRSGMKEWEFVARFIAMAIHNFIYLSPTYLFSADSNDDETFKELVTGQDIDKYIYSFNNFEPYKRMMTDNIYDLQKYLQSIK